MKKNLLFLVLFCGFSIYSFAQKITLVENQKSNYSIVIPKNANANEVIASKLMQEYIKKISDCELPIIGDDSKSKNEEIVIGNTNRSDKNWIKSKLPSLKEDGYCILTKSQKLFILGGSERGIIYGVTGFLEDYLQCRKYSIAVEYVPQNKTISISQIDDTQIPPAFIRIVNGEFCQDTLYQYFRKITNVSNVWNEGNYHGYFVHTLPRIIPSDVYFKQHPEYFSMINGARVPYGQYCLSNPDVLKITIADLKKQIAAHPNLKYWSVSQHDNYYHCECESCKKIDQEEGSPSGLMIRFVNAVAKEFPDKIITTLAYQYTRKPPLKTKPLDNVMITLCTIELNRSLPIETDSSSADFAKDIIGWGKISNKIMLWDYETQFSSSFGPFPLYNTLQPNIQFFTKNQVIAHFQQCNGKHSENFWRNEGVSIK